MANEKQLRLGMDSFIARIHCLWQNSLFCLIIERKSPLQPKGFPLTIKGETVRLCIPFRRDICWNCILLEYEWLYLTKTGVSFCVDSFFI